MSAAGLRKLAQLSAKTERTILGLMSGTSLDGLDIALCRIAGAGFKTQLSVDRFVTLPYTDRFRADVLQVFSKKTVDLEALTLLNRHVAETHAALIGQALQDWNIDAAEVDAIASHGQTIYHAPKSLHGRMDRGDGTLQIGDGDHLAVRTGITTCSDFRQKHLAAGGEGAPLAAYGDLLLLSDEEEPRFLLNIGGIANFTFLPALDAGGEAFSSDIGPGNTLMDALVRQHFAPATFDRDAERARSGKVDERLLAELRSEPFFAKPFPKTTGPELFSLDWLAAKTNDGMSPHDVLATLNRLSAETIAEAAAAVHPAAAIYVSGGGALNPLLMETLRDLLPQREIRTTEALGLDPDAKEAVLFAILANELLAGSPETFRGRIKDAPATSMGKISLPG